MVRGSMVPREIDLEEKQVYAPTSMIQKPFFSVPVVAAPTVQNTVVPAPVVSSPVVAINENEEPVLQDPLEPVAAEEGGNNSPKYRQKCQQSRPLEGLNE